MNDNSCYICDSNNYRLITKKSKYSIVKCKKCDFVFTTPIPNREELDKYYQRFDYKDSLTAENIIRSDAKRSLGKIGSFFEKSGDILDVGSGRGYFLDEARKLGWNTFGVDASELVTDYAKNILHLNIFHNDIFSFHSTRTFDLVTLNQVIEHFVNPKELIIKCSKNLNGGGLLYIATPNIESISAKVLKENFDHFIPPEHLGYFSQYTLKRLLEELGFKVIYVGSWSYPSDLGGIIKTLLGKNLKREQPCKFVTKTYTANSNCFSRFNTQQVKSFLFDRVFCYLFYKVLNFDSWGINLEILGVKL